MSNISMNKVHGFLVRGLVGGCIRNVRIAATAKSYLLTLAVKTPLLT